MKQIESSYFQDTFYEVTAFNTHERAILYEMHMRDDSITFLNSVTNEAAMTIPIIVDKCCTESFESALKANDITYKKHDSLSPL